MKDNTGWTPAPKENKLGVRDRNTINNYEAKGIAMAELFIFSLDSNTSVTINLILKIHKTAFEEMYEWAGKWRDIDVVVGQIKPPSPFQIPHLMYQFIDNLNHKVLMAKNKEDVIDCIQFSHYEYVRIHPFKDGNGRTGRILMNFIALKLGYQPLTLYYRGGDSRKEYIQAMRKADEGNFKPLKRLIMEELTPY